VNFLPPLKIAQGEAFGYSATVVGQDWTGFTGVAVFKSKPQASTFRRIGTDVDETLAEPILSVTVTGDNAGELSFALTGAQSALLPALPRIGYFHTCAMQITMTSGADVQRFQARVSVAGAL
jgi:hypothetical protein